MATREELKLNKLKKNIETLEKWIEKNSEMTTKKVRELQKDGVLVDFYKYYNPYLEDRKKIALLWKDLRQLDDKTADALVKYVSDEFYIVRDNEDNLTKTKYKNQINALDTLWSRFGNDFTSKYAELNVYKKRLKDMEDEYSLNQSKKSTEQIEQEKKIEEKKERKKNLKEELANYSLPSLDAWLDKYRILFSEWLETAHNDGDIKTYQYYEMKRNIDKYVEKQKLEVLTNAWDIVGRVTDIHIPRIASNGVFNGVVTGEKGKVNIETIIAGGYNIQRLHYRVLFSKLGARENKNKDKLDTYFNNKVFEVKFSYPTESEYLSSKLDNSMKISAKKFVNISSFTSFSKYLDNEIAFIFNNYNSLNKKEKILFSKKLAMLNKLKDRKFGIFVMNNGEISISYYTEDFTDEVIQLKK